jgi:GcrA cell cycle regulator
MTSSRTPPVRRDVTARDGWADAAVETLKRLWGEPDLSAAMIAQRLGVTRNAVLGKIHRLGLSKPRASRQPVARVPAPRRLRPAPARIPRLAIPQSVAASPAARIEAEAPALVRHLEDLPRRTCHWPLGDPRAVDFGFCGRRVERSPYCPAHAAIAYRGPGVKGAELARLLRR